MPHAGGTSANSSVRASPYEPGVYFVQEETWQVRSAGVARVNHSSDPNLYPAKLFESIAFITAAGGRRSVNAMMFSSSWVPDHSLKYAWLWTSQQESK